MMESVILDHQKTAEVRGMLLSSVLTMLPVLTYGALQSYLAIGLPQLLEQNETGILLDIIKMSWISMILDLFKSLFTNNDLQSVPVNQRGYLVSSPPGFSRTKSAGRSV